MQRYANWARDNEGRAYPGALVSVYVAGTSTLAQIYTALGDTDNPGGASNPITTGSDGYYAFAAPDGYYDIQVFMGSNPVQVIPNVAFVAATSSGQQIKFTPDGGLAVLFINDTGAPTVKGEVVTPSASVDRGVTKIVVGVPNPIGAFLDSGVANGDEAWVVVSGCADVYYVSSATRGHLSRGFLSSDGGIYVSGQALSEAFPSPPFASDKHFYELGHVMESRTGAGLAKTLLHFN